MNKFIDAIKELKKSGDTISLYYPGKGFCLGTITDVKDDYITVAIPQENADKDKLVMHYTQLILQRD